MKNGKDLIGKPEELDGQGSAVEWQCPRCKSGTLNYHSGYCSNCGITEVPAPAIVDAEQRKAQEFDGYQAAFGIDNQVNRMLAVFPIQKWPGQWLQFTRTVQSGLELIALQAIDELIGKNGEKDGGRKQVQDAEAGELPDS